MFCECLIILFKIILIEDYKIFLKNYLVFKNKSIIVRVYIVVIVIKV